MRSIRTDPQLQQLADEVETYASSELGMTLPAMRFFILDPMEFASLLEKNVYPTSPVNIWEGKHIINKKHRIETGQESALYYEVVQTGNPSYAYLNETNSVMTQASVMAHVTGHCEFSELNVLHDSDIDRTEYIMYLVRKVDLARQQMGEKNYINYWNACESVVPFIKPNSQFNLKNSVETESFTTGEPLKEVSEEEGPSLMPLSDSLDSFMDHIKKNVTAIMEEKRDRREALNRSGYRLRAPCEDITGFLRQYAPTTHAEKSILNYLYEVRKHQDFIIKTQIMNEGWAMYWEKKIMLQLFRKRLVGDIIDYSRVFSGVCYPQPFFRRNPYHLGYHLWNHIEEQYKEGKVSEDYHNEKNVYTKLSWSRPSDVNPVDKMRHLVSTITDYEFLRRFLTLELIEKLHLNRIPLWQVKQLGINKEDIVRADKNWVWLHPEPIKPYMLNFFTHYFRPRIYVVDNNFMDGGLLLFHRNDGQALRQDWIKPTLKNIHQIWKSPVHLISRDTLSTFGAQGFRKIKIDEVQFNVIRENMLNNKKAYIPG
jgi:stage V sporulation protein R